MEKYKTFFGKNISVRQELKKWKPRTFLLAFDFLPITNKSLNLDIKRQVVIIYTTFLLNITDKQIVKNMVVTRNIEVQSDQIHLCSACKIFRES
jgi:hypothetical protein